MVICNCRFFFVSKTENTTRVVDAGGTGEGGLEASDENCVFLQSIVQCLCVCMFVNYIFCVYLYILFGF